MDEPQINLGQLVGRDHKYELSISHESPQDADARRQGDMADAALRRRMSFMLFVFALAMTACVFAACFWVLWHGSADDRKWAGGVVSAMASGLVGYLVGQHRK